MRKPSLTRCLASALAAAAFLSASARAQQIRSAHTASLLPTGDILLAGGVDNTGAVLNSADLVLTSKGKLVAGLPPMNVARASATATVMATGMVLVAGGIDGAGNARADAEIYDPASNSWTCVPAGCPNTGMTNPRYDHTATLLFTGKVLLCGGQNLAGTVWPSCDLFTPSALPAIGGSFSATGPLQQARALHTATLLKNGKVWIAGGWNPAAAATNGWLPTTERYDPVSGTFSSAQPLASARGLHTATMLGNGKVLIAGGYNGANVLANFGVLDSMEIYDPVSNSVLPASPLNSRREMQSATLAADGAVEFFGGLGNVTTTYLSNPAWTTLSQTLTIGDVFSGQLSTGNVTTASATIPKPSFLLGTPVVGHIQNGEVLFSSPSIPFTGGIVYFPPTAPPDNPAVGLRASLNGVTVDCQLPGPPQNNCGFIKTALTVANLNQGQVYFDPITGSVSGNAAVDGLNDTFIYFSPSPLGTSVTGSLLPGSSIYANITINFPAAVSGATISSGTITLTGGTVTQASTYTITLTGGYAAIPPGTVVGTGGVTTLNAYFYGLQGTIAGLGSNPTSGQPMPEPSSKASVSLTGTVNYVASSVNLGGAALKVDVATVVVRGMVFGDPEYYNPASNQTVFTPPTVGGGGVVGISAADAVFGLTSTLLPNNDRFRAGGSDCSGPTCAAFTAKAVGPVGWNSTALTLNKAFGAGASLATARALHTATLLSNGTILVAGGTNGLNVLPTAEIFDPVAGTFSPTNGPMSVVRDLHTASLLPNGRVLLAGGFTTNATSTGSTNAVDVYYPDTKLFLPTSVMISSRSNHTATSLADGSVLAVGGYGAADVITASAEVYYATAAAWTPVAPLAVGQCDAGAAGHPERALHSATLLKDGRLLVAGGINSQGVQSSVCAYNPATNAWTQLASLPRQLRSHSATLLPDGRVLVAGGGDGFGEFNASFIYDPGLNSWSTTSPTAPLLQPRFGHSATLLPNATVMISGGVNRFGAVADEIELFHVNGSSWVSGGNRFSQGTRAFHTMTLAPNGKVYAIGGGNGVIGGSGTSLYSAGEQSYFTFSPDVFTPGAPPSLRQSTIAATSPNPVAAGLAAFNVTGLQFRGGTEASGGGAASANSSFSYPRLVLQSLGASGGGASQGDAGFIVDLTTQVYLNGANLATLDTSLTVPLPALTSPGVSNGLPRGWYSVRTGANDVYANGAFVQIGPAKPAAAPAASSGTVVGTSSITWTWTAVAGVDGYDVYQATSLVFLGTAAATANPYFYQTGLAPNTTASVAIAGYTASGDGPLLFSSTYFTLANPPSQVQVASVSFNSLLLEWNPNGNIQGALYEVSQSTDWPSPFSASVSTPVPAGAGLTASSVLITGLLANTTYSFRVRTFNAALAPSNFSVMVTTRTRTPVAGGVTGAALSLTSIQWNWIDPGGAIYFNVYNATSGVVVATTTVPTYTDAGLGANTPRSVAVSAVTAAGEGPLTPGPTVYTLAAAPAPVFPFLTSLSTGGFAAQWTANGNPLGTTYQAVDTAYVPNPNNNKLIPAVMSTVTTTALSAGFAGLTPAQYATVSVVAINGNGIASAALTGSTYTFANPPASPLVTNTTPASISLSWSIQNNSTSTVYQITYSTDNFVTSLATGIPFSSGLNGSAATVAGLLTGATYWLRLQGQNPFGVLTQFSPTVMTITNNGGAPAGSLGGVLTAIGRSSIQGNLGNGRSVLVRSPSGAFPSDVALVISSYNATTPLCPNGLNVAFSLAQTPAFQPSRPLYFSASYAPAELGGFAPAQVALMRFEPASGTCVPLSTTFDTTGLTFTSELNHFSLYELAGVPLASDLSAARIFPNPFRAARDAYVTIDRIPPGARVRVMTLRGEPVLDQTANGSGLLVWSATNGAGRSVASGLYLILVDWAGAHKVLKLAVIR